MPLRPTIAMRPLSAGLPLPRARAAAAAAPSLPRHGGAARRRDGAGGGHRRARRSGRAWRAGAIRRSRFAIRARGPERPSELTAAMARLEAALSVAGPAVARRGGGARRLPARGRPCADGRGPDRPARAGPRLGDADVPPARGGGARSGTGGAAHACRLSRRDRHEPQVRHGDPRGPRPARHPPANARGPRPGPRARGTPATRPAGTRDRSIGHDGDRAGRRSIDPVRRPQARRRARRRAAAASRDPRRRGRRRRDRRRRRIDPDPGRRDRSTSRRSGRSRTTSRSPGPSPRSPPRSARRTSELAIVVGGDMPGLVPPCSSRCCDRLATTATSMRPSSRARAIRSGTPPGPAARAFESSVASTAAGEAIHAGDRSLVRLLDRLRSVEVPASEWLALDPAGRTLLDVDRPEDLERIHRNFR